MYVPSKQPHHPEFGNAFTRWLGRMAFRVLGWKMAGEFPKDKQCVAVLAPHTSNWDFVFTVIAMLAIGIKFSWMGKHTLFRWPVGGALRGLGGVSVNRAAAHGVVGEMVHQFKSNPDLILGITPEGTRSKVREWKTGFLSIAKEAKVPVVAIYLDFKNKVLGFGPMFVVSDDIQEDLDKIRDFYSQFQGKHSTMSQ